MSEFFERREARPASTQLASGRNGGKKDKPRLAELISQLLGDFRSSQPDRGARIDPEICQIGRFDQLEMVGHGGFGLVFRAWDTRMQRWVAVKMPRLEWQSDHRVVSRFKKEARTVAKLRHPNIVPVFESDTVDNVFIIVTELSDGPSLDAWLNENSRPPIPTCLSIFQQIIEAIAYAHRENVIHLDLKPANILVEQWRYEAAEAYSDYPGMHVRITDFGLAKNVSEAKTLAASSTLMGTPAYMAPEQFLERTSGPDHRVDIFAMGVLIYEIVTGQNPFADESLFESVKHVIEKKPAPISALRRDAPRQLDKICAKCIEKLPEDRYQSANELLADVKRLAAGDLFTIPGVGWSKRIRNWIRQPDRITEASKIVVANHLGIVIWITTILLAGLTGIMPSSRQADVDSMFQNTLGVIVVYHIPMIVIGLTLRQLKPTVIGVALVASLVVYGWSFVMAIGLVPTPFPLYEGNAAFRVFVLNLVTVVGAFQTIWLWFAWQAKRALRLQHA